MPEKGRAATRAQKPASQAIQAKEPDESQHSTGDSGQAVGDINFILEGLRLRGLNGPNGLIRMGGWKRQKYSKAVQAHVRVALDSAGWRRILACQEERKALRIEVVHKGEFDDDSLHASVKPLLDALKPVKGKIVGDPGLPGLLRDDSPSDIDLEVIQSRGPYAVLVKAWSPGLMKTFAGATVTITAV